MPRSTSLRWLPLLVGLLGCDPAPGTYVKLNFLGTVAQNQPIASIAVDLQFEGGASASTQFLPESGGAITLPTDAVLDIHAGAGLLHVSARALASDHSVLGIATGSGIVVRGKTVPITVTFGESSGDAGVDGPPALDGPPGPGLDGGADAQTRDAFGDNRPDLPMLADSGRDGPRMDLGLGGRDADVDVPGTGGNSTDGSVDGASANGGAGGNGGTGGSGGGGVGGTSGTYQLVATPSPLDLGPTLLGSTSQPAMLTITNIGTEPSPALTIFFGDDIHFSVSSDACGGQPLPPGRTCTLAFAFKPSEIGLIQSDGVVGPAGGDPAKFTLVGTGISGNSQIALSPSTVDFGVIDVTIGSSVDFTVTNTGTTDAGTIAIQSIGSEFFHITTNRCTGSLAPQSRCLFTLVFAPAAYGKASAAINAQSSSGAAASSSATGIGRDYVQLSIDFVAPAGARSTGHRKAAPAAAPAISASHARDPTLLPQFTLTAQPDNLSVFEAWEGDCKGTGDCTVVMSADRAITAAFNPRMVALDLAAFGLAGQQGSLVSDDGSISCSGSCPNLSHPAVTSFTLTARPGSGSTFAGWTSGPCKGTALKCTFPLTDPVGISATFGPQSYMFVSSSTVIPGKLGGLAGADDECTKLATNAGLPGTYAAWLSSSTADANSRVGEGGWIRTDGRPFAHDYKSLSDSARMTVYYPPRLDERGNDVGNMRTLVATGSRADGSRSGSSCADYTNTSGSLAMGDASSGAYAWSNSSVDNTGCASARRLYCFRRDLNPGFISPPPQDGRRVFVTTNPFVIRDGLSPNELCWKDAETAGITDPKAFVAFVATTSTPAIKLVKQIGLPWKRMDDVLVARQAGDLGDGKLLAPIDVTADGKGYENARVWTGASDPTAVGSATCGDWTGSVPTTAVGMAGDSQTTSDPMWFNQTSIPCDNTAARLYCVEP